MNIQLFCKCLFFKYLFLGEFLQKFVVLKHQFLQVKHFDSVSVFNNKYLGLDIHLQFFRNKDELIIMNLDKTNKFRLTLDYFECYLQRFVTFYGG